jgi:hypothetical protein
MILHRFQQPARGFDARQQAKVSNRVSRIITFACEGRYQ